MVYLKRKYLVNFFTFFIYSYFYIFLALTNLSLKESFVDKFSLSQL